jgi:cytochrome P450
MVHLITRPDHIQHVLVRRNRNYFKGYGYDAQKLLLGEGLITSEGELWERQHRLMQPFFTPAGVTRFADTMIGATRTMLERWAPMADGNQVIHVDAEMARLTGNIIVRLLFNRDLDDQTSRIDEAFQYCIGFIDKRSADLIALPMCFPTPEHRRFKRYLARLHHYIDDRINEHRRDAPTRDFLSVLLQAEDEETGQRMSRRQLRDELVTLFVAGYQTTMHALTWTWYLLDRHPQVADRLRQEHDVVLEGRMPTVADVQRLRYTGMVFQEVMRLYPPVKVIVREAVEDDEIDGYYIPAGSLVLVSPYITQRHPDFWDDPETFDPERFTPEQSESRSRYAYIPFSAGPRICLGNHFALLESAIILTMVTRHYRLQLVPGHPVEPSMEVKTRPLYGMRMTLHPRI